MSTKEKLTTVNTTYARIAVLLLAGQMLVTGYAVYALNNTGTPSQEATTEQKQEDSEAKDQAASD